MAKTIIQTIGPLYGEAVNGTVFGRPNGSVYTPSVNTIKATVPSEYVAINVFNSRYYLVVANSEGVRVGVITRVAESQDIANYMAWEFADNSDFTDSAIFNSAAGQFNLTNTAISQVASTFEIVDGDTYYLRAVLCASTGVPVAYSDVFELTGVAE